MQKLIQTHDVPSVLYNARGRFASVTFQKKDGTLTTKTLQPAAAPFHLVKNPTPAGKKAAKTRRENNLSLVNHRTARGGWVSFDLGKVVSVKACGVEYAVVAIR